MLKDRRGERFSRKMEIDEGAFELTSKFQQLSNKNTTSGIEKPRG
jgi:hypothetical protein